MKGDHNELCNRTACSNRPATYYNHSTQKYYCISCAARINEYNATDALRLFGHDLCTYQVEPLQTSPKDLQK